MKRWSNSRDLLYPKQSLYYGDVRGASQALRDGRSRSAVLHTELNQGVLTRVSVAFRIVHGFQGGHKLVQLIASAV